MGKAEENKLYKFNQLLETAFDLFVQNGIAKTSIADISKAAGVGKGTFYLYFKDKQDLEARLISRRAGQLFRRAQQALVAHPEISLPEDKIIFMVDTMLEELAQDPCLLKFIYKNLSWGIFRNVVDHPQSKEDLNARDLLAELDEDCWENPELMLYTIIELASSTCYNVILRQDPCDLETFLPFLNRSIRSILRDYRRQ